MTLLRRLLAAACLLCLSTSPLQAEPIVIGETASIHSEILGEDRPLSVSLPHGYEGSAEAYPVFVVLDAETRFQHSVANVRALATLGRIPDMIVVGVGNTDRTRDLTPPWTGEDPPEDRLELIAAGGGADTFLRFLGEELLPHLDRTYRTTPLRILEGHSFGGLFAVHTLIHGPDLFGGIIAISPSLWWDSGASVGQAAELFRQRPELKSRFYTCLADEGQDMLTQFQSFEDLLRHRAPSSLHHEVQYFPGEDHSSVTIPAVHAGLVHIFERWAAPAIVLAEGLPAVDRHYEELAADFGYPIETPENVINRMGYGALGDDPEQAIRLFRENVKRFPESANVYDSLAEALENEGELEEAARLYEKAWKKAEATSHPSTDYYRSNHERVRGLLEGNGQH